MLNLKDIALALQATLIGLEKEIRSVKQIDDPSFDDHSIAWCSDKNIELIQQLRNGSVIVSKTGFEAIKELPNSGITFLVVDHPRKAFSKMLLHFFVEKPSFGIQGNNCSVHASVNYNPETVFFGNNVVIEANCSIGNKVVIDHNTVIKSGTIIRDGVKIGSNCTIGGVGFGYEPNEEGIYEVIPHIGNVVLKEAVEIGNNVCIDRAVLGSTTLENHVKVDNLVHIAHGVQIGKNSLVIANAMIAGSVKIGENCWIAPSASIIQKVNIGNDVLIGMGSVVLKNVEDHSKMAGVPAKKLN